MADENTTQVTKNYFDLTGLQLYDSLLKDHISKEDAKSIKTVAISADGKKLRFYRISEPVGESTPAYEFEYPETDLSGVIAKISGAINGHVLTATSDGGAQDSGVALSSLAKTTDVEKKIAEAVSTAAHMKKKIVEELPAVDDADENTFYLMKDSTVQGNDKYKVYVLINNAFEMIDDTSVDMSGYYNQEQINGLLADAKAAAINDAVAAAATDAQTKADAALSSAKDYTDEKITTVNTSIAAVDAKTETNATAIVEANTRIDSVNDRIDSIAAITGDGIGSISEEDIRALFAEE